MRPALRSCSFLLAACVLACSTPQASVTAPADPRRSSSPPSAPTSGTLALVESAPLETTLDHPDIPNARDEWPKLIAQATRTLDIAQFYVSNKPGSVLEPVIQAVEAAADRGVHVRVLAEEKFTKTYPETLARLATRKNIEVRHFNVGPLMGGILHAKYFVVDGVTAYIGSQNFDWRSLEHIQELGFTVREPEILRSVADVFETDWQLAAGGPKDARVATAHPSYPVTVTAEGEPTRVTPVFSPKGFLPDETLWDLPRMVALIDGAKKSVRVQVLTYKAVSHGERFPDLDDALIRAAGRGVQVELLVSSWSTRKGTLEGLQTLGRTPNLIIRVLTIPPWSGGEIDFARVVHAKYMAVDGEKAWVGTSNWERDYFLQSRNLGVILEGHAVATRLERFFDDGWSSRYAGPLPETAPRPTAPAGSAPVHADAGTP